MVFRCGVFGGGCVRWKPGLTLYRWIVILKPGQVTKVLVFVIIGTIIWDFYHCYETSWQFPSTQFSGIQQWSAGDREKKMAEYQVTTFPQLYCSSVNWPLTIWTPRCLPLNVPGAADRHRVPRQDCEAGAWSLSGISLLLDLIVRPLCEYSILSKFANFLSDILWTFYYF